MYLVYNIIQCQSASLGYSLLVKSKQWMETQSFIWNISHTELCEIAEAIQSTNTYTYLGILALKR